MLHRIHRFLISHYRWIFCVSIVVTLASAYPLSKLTVENTYLDWVEQDDRLYAEYQDFKRVFGNDETFYFVLSMEDVFGERHFFDYGDFIQKLKNHPAIENILDPMSLYLNRFHPQSRSWERVKKYPEKRTHHFLRDIRKSRALPRLIVSDDGQHAGLLLYLKEGLRAEQQRGLLSEIQQALEGMGIDYTVAGPIYFNLMMTDIFKRDLVRVLSLLFVSAFVILYICLRKLRIIISIFIGILMSLALTFSLFFPLGAKLGLLSLVLFPLIFCIGMTTSIHLFLRVSHYAESGPDAFHRAFVSVFTPAFIAAFTTALGTLVFIFAPSI